eukprot:scaffold3471_cov87-Attheya_sp.AAC.2
MANNVSQTNFHKNSEVGGKNHYPLNNKNSAHQCSRIYDPSAATDLFRKRLDVVSATPRMIIVIIHGDHLKSAVPKTGGRVVVVYWH